MSVPIWGGSFLARFAREARASREDARDVREAAHESAQGLRRAAIAESAASAEQGRWSRTLGVSASVAGDAKTAFGKAADACRALDRQAALERLETAREADLERGDGTWSALKAASLGDDVAVSDRFSDAQLDAMMSARPTGAKALEAIGFTAPEAKRLAGAMASDEPLRPKEKLSLLYELGFEQNPSSAARDRRRSEGAAEKAVEQLGRVLSGLSAEPRSRAQRARVTADRLRQIESLLRSAARNARDAEQAQAGLELRARRASRA